MMRFLISSAALAAALIGGGLLVAPSEASGLSNLHEQVRIGNRICMVGHYHYGQSGAWATRAQAVAAAAQSWAGFTALEYGDEWAEFRLANQQDMSCKQSDDDRGGVLWSCDAKAMPCRPAEHQASGAPPVAAPHLVRIQTHPRKSAHRALHRRLGPPHVVPGDPHVHRDAPRSALVWPGDRR